MHRVHIHAGQDEVQHVLGNVAKLELTQRSPGLAAATVASPSTSSAAAAAAASSAVLVQRESKICRHVVLCDMQGRPKLKWYFRML